MNTSHVDNVTHLHDFRQRGMTVTQDRPLPRTRREVPSARNQDDDSLATRIALGDVGAAEELRSRYEDRLTRIAYDVLGDDSEAERIVEAALEDAFRGWPPGRGQVAWWLRSIVRRRARARKRVLGGCDA